MKQIHIASVLRNASGDFTNNGITSHYSSLYVFSEDWNVDEIEQYIAGRNIHRNQCVQINQYKNYVRAFVVFQNPQKDGTYMAGGNFVCSSDANFINMVGHNYPISVHDRFESWEQYDTLSR